MAAPTPAPAPASRAAAPPDVPPARPAGFAAADPVYVDYNAGTPTDPRVAAAMAPFLTDAMHANPSSGYPGGRAVKAALEVARAQVASAVGAASASEIVFTSGGTEAINMALTGAVRHFFSTQAPSTDASTGCRTMHVITSAIEHVAVLRTLENMHVTLGGDAREAPRFRLEVTRLGVDKWGRVSVQDAVDAVRGNTGLVTLMLANNEVGTVQPVAEIVGAIKAAHADKPILFHCDTSQAIGKIPVDLASIGVDYACVAGHKLYAPKGIGALYKRAGAPALFPIMFGGGQEHGQRAGTENVIMAVGLGKACELAAASLEAAQAQFATLKAMLLEKLTEGSAVPPHVNSPEEGCLPNTLSVAFPSVSAQELLKRVEGSVWASAMSACHTGELTVSYVLQAMGVPIDVAASTVRLSVGRFTTAEQIARVASILCEAVAALQGTGVPAGGSAAGAGVGAGAGAGGNTCAAVPSASGGETLDFEAMADTTRLYFDNTMWVRTSAKVVGSATVEQLPEAWRRKGFTHAVCTEGTIFHPQGGGQPSDEGVMVLGKHGADVVDDSSSTTTIPAGTLLFKALHARGAPGTGVVVHYGSFGLTGPDGLVTDLSEGPVADLAVAGTDQAFTAGDVVTQLVSRAVRMANARCHSAGHLLDMAMSTSGYDLPPGRGYHFTDGPFVEYIGSIPAAERPALVERLQAEVDRLVAARVPTVVKSGTPGSSVMGELGVRPEFLSGYKPDQELRIVAVGGSDCACPCGGTHVVNTAQIGGMTIKKLTVKKKKTKIYYACN